jgi:hydroxymethylpyrimidine pyrophosphatase-like HAD family hydrolase
MLYDTVSENNVPLQRYIEWAKRLHGDDAEHAVMHVEDLHEVLPDQEVIHISYSGQCEPMERMMEYLTAELDGSVTILPTIYPELDFTLIDILPSDASKGTGVEKLAALNGLTAENVMVIGDNFNDLEMLEFAGTPVVMGNASPDLLGRKEFYKTLNNNESGVAAAIRRFILQKQEI